MKVAERRSGGFDWVFYFYWLVAGTLGWVVGGLFVAGVAFLASGAAMGVLQWLPLERRLPRAFRWIPATVAGWLGGWMILLFVNPGQNAFLTGMVLGLCVGFAQWLILRRELELAGWWIAISIVAWTTGFALLPGFFNTGMIPAAITGFALELLLRFPRPRSEL